MKNKGKKYNAWLIIFFTLLLFTIVNGAESTITLKVNQGGTHLESTRTGKYSYAEARCIAVYPQGGGVDNFTKIRVKLCDTFVMCEGFPPISDEYILYESAGGNTQLYFWEGYLSKKRFTFCFYGNNPELAAEAKVYYNGL